ncbi:MAG: NHL repeat-containing protein [Planctomycetota bacterium]
MKQAGALLALVALTYALEGTGETTVTQLFTADQVETAIGWSHAEFGLGVPRGYGNGIAAAPSGDLFFVVYGFTTSSNPSDPQPIHTALIRYDGNTFTELVEYQENQGTGPHTGKFMHLVTVSPSDAGLLSVGQPVLLRHENTLVGGSISSTIDIVSVDASSGSQTLLYSFGVEAANAHLAIDSDGTIYVGPMSDGTIRRLEYAAAGEYNASTVDTGVAAGFGLVIDDAGNLYTFAEGVYWGGASGDDKEILQIDPVTGDAASYASVGAWNFVFDWAWSDGKLWVGAREAKRRKKQVPHHYVAEVAPGTVVDAGDRITDSADDPQWVAAGTNGNLIVIETGPGTVDTAYEVTPGMSGGGGKGGGKGKNK